jgi:hypothetical protein
VRRALLDLAPLLRGRDERSSLLEVGAKRRVRGSLRESDCERIRGESPLIPLLPVKNGEKGASSARAST